MQQPTSPPGFPADVPVGREQFLNWSWTINVPDVWTCVPQTSADVVAVCNWAAGAGYLVRARGIMHSWSPVTVDLATVASSKVVLVDTTRHLTGMAFVPRSGNAAPRVTVGAGATMEELLAFLEQQPGGTGAAAGYSFPHVPAPGHITVGGALAINAHGSAVPNVLEGFDASYGSLSNQILAFTAVVTDPSAPDRYALRTFTRGEGDDAALLTHLGRAFLIDATLQVIDNYNLRCQSFTNIPVATLFAQPTTTVDPPPQSVGAYLDASGRIEVIWYPFTTTAWFKVWTNTPDQPAGSRQATGPYNYPFSDNLPDWVTALFALVTDADPPLTKYLGTIMQGLTEAGLGLFDAYDLWGPSKDVLLYVKDQTLRVTANGYAVHLKRGDVQQAVYDFTTKYTELLTSFAANGQYPVNAPLEIRVTGLDDALHVAATGARPPVISSLSADRTDAQNGWDSAVWFDVLTLPNTPSSNQFYADLESWVQRHFSGTYAKALPEWSKGWAYTPEFGPWTSEAYGDAIRAMFTAGRSADDNWDWEVATLQKYDAKGLFSNWLLARLFVDAAASSKPSA